MSEKGFGLPIRSDVCGKGYSKGLGGSPGRQGWFSAETNDFPSLCLIKYSPPMSTSYSSPV